MPTVCCLSFWNVSSSANNEQQTAGIRTRRCVYLPKGISYFFISKGRSVYHTGEKRYSFPRDFFSLFPVVSFVFFFHRFGSPCHSERCVIYHSEGNIICHIETGIIFDFPMKRVSTMDLLSQSAAQPLARCLCHQTAQMPNCRYETSRTLCVRLAGFLVSMKNPKTSFRVKV